MDSDIVKIFTEKLLTPIIYKYEKPGIVLLAGFFDSNLLIKTVYETRSLIRDRIGKEVQIIDIRNLPESERYDFAIHSEVIYTENQFVKQMFETAMVDDFKQSLKAKSNLIRRKNSSGSIYLS